MTSPLFNVQVETIVLLWIDSSYKDCVLSCWDIEGYNHFCLVNLNTFNRLESLEKLKISPEL